MPLASVSAGVIPVPKISSIPSALTSTLDSATTFKPCDSTKSGIPSLSLSKSSWSGMPSPSESFGTQVAINFNATLLVLESERLMLVIIIEFIKFPLMEKVPVPAAKETLLFNRNRISKEECCVMPLSKMPS